MWRLKRIVVITVGLAAVGAVLGAICGAGLMLLADVIEFGPGRLRFDIPEVVSLQVGAFLGAILAPASAWLLMRRIPLWRAILEPTIGTCAGAMIAILLWYRTDAGILLDLAGALVGFTVSVLRLRFAKARAPSAHPPTPA